MAGWVNTVLVALLKAVTHIIQVVIARIKWTPARANERAEAAAHYKSTGLRSPANGKPYGVKPRPKSGKARGRG